MRNILSTVMASFFLFGATNLAHAQELNTEEYFPLELNNEWINDLGAKRRISEGKFNKKDPTAKRYYLTINDSSNYAQIFGRHSTKGVVLLGLRMNGADYFFSAPIQYLPKSITIGSSVTSSATITTSTGSLLKYTMKVEFLDLDPVTLANGAILPHVIRNRISTTTEVVGGSQAPSITVEDNWLARGIGLVRIEGIEGVFGYRERMAAAITYFPSGRIRSQLNSNFQEGLLFFDEYLDEGAGNRGPTTFTLSPDGSFSRAKKFHERFRTAKFLFSYNLAGKLISVKERNEIGETIRTIDGSYAGDSNLDCEINLGDLNDVRNNFGQFNFPGLSLSDFDADGSVGLSDLNAVRNNFGRGCANFD